MKISIVIPTYNESDNIKFTIQEIFMILNKISDINRVEIIIVDDHSSDITFAVIKEMNDLRVKCLRLSRRCGSHTAIRAGLRETTGDVILCISADGQDDPVCLINMLEKWRSGIHVVWALRVNRQIDPWHTQVFAKLFYKLLIWLGGGGRTNIDISRANFCLLDKIVVEAMNKCQERNTSLFGLVTWLGFNQDSVEYQRRQRKHGKSNWNFMMQLRLAKDWVVGFSGLPLTLIFVSGILITLTGFFYGLYLIINLIQGRAINHWLVVMTSILFFGGIQMIMLGIVGEYLWHNLEEARHRPLFLIEKRSDR